MLLWSRIWVVLVALISAILFATGSLSHAYNGKNDLAAFLLIAGLMMLSISVRQLWLRSSGPAKMQRFKGVTVFICGFLMMLCTVVVSSELVFAWFNGEIHVATRGGGGFFVNYDDDPKKFGFYFLFYSVVASVSFVVGCLMIIKPLGLKSADK